MTDTIIKSKKLLLVVNEPAFFLSHRLNIALEAIRRGYQVSVATPMEPLAHEIATHGITHHSFSLKKWGLNPINDLLTLISLTRLYRTLKPDIVHHVSIKPVIYGSIAAKIARVPAVVNAVSGLGFIFISKGVKAAVRRFLVKYLYRIALCGGNQITIVQNPDDREVFLSNRFTDPARIRLVRGSGVNPEIYLPTATSNNAVHVLMISRLLIDKGVREFVEAASELKNAKPNVEFSVAGDFPEGNPQAVPRADYERWLNEGVVQFLGKRRDIPELLKSVDIVCLPSYREGLPRCLIEAASAGKPIVATDVPGCREIVLDNINGLLVPPRDIRALAKALCKLIDDSELRKKFGNAGRSMVLHDGFTEQVVLSQTFSLYDELLSLAN